MVLEAQQTLRARVPCAPLFALASTPSKEREGKQNNTTLTLRTISSPNPKNFGNEALPGVPTLVTTDDCTSNFVALAEHFGISQAGAPPTLTFIRYPEPCQVSPLSIEVRVSVPH